MGRIARRLAVNVHELVAKGEIVARHRHGVLWAPRRIAPEAPRVLWEASDIRDAVRTKVAVHTIVAANQLVHYRIDIDVEPAGMCDGNRALQLFAATKTGLDSTHLVFRSDIVLIKNAVAVTRIKMTRLGFADRRGLQ